VGIKARSYRDKLIHALKRLKVNTDLIDFLRRVVECIVHSSMFVGFVGIAMVFTTSLLLNLPISPYLLLILFLISFSVYNINRKTDIKEDKISHPLRAMFIEAYYNHIKIIAVLCYATALLLGFLRSFLVGMFILVPLLFVGLYSLRWIPKSSASRLKEIFIVKNFTVAFAWALAVTSLPLVYFESGISIAVVFIFLFIFLKVFGNTVTFDVRDIKGDVVHKIRTVPIKLGIEKTKRLLIAINLASFFVLLIPALLDLLPSIAYFVSLVTVYTHIYIHLIGKVDIKFLTDVLADGEYLVMAVLAFIGSLLLW
jgi:4-hydroxybenzoate polyprenyltransferase